MPVLILGAVLLYRAVDPSCSVWLPQCPFRMLTGWECPACGGQRALHSLLHARVGEALRYNPFLVVSVPYFLAVAWTAVGRSPLAVRMRPVVQHRAMALSYCLLFLLWWVVRNLPGTGW